MIVSGRQTMATTVLSLVTAYHFFRRFGQAGYPPHTPPFSKPPSPSFDDSPERSQRFRGDHEGQLVLFFRAPTAALAEGSRSGDPHALALDRRGPGPPWPARHAGSCKPRLQGMVRRLRSGPGRDPAHHLRRNSRATTRSSCSGISTSPRIASITWPRSWVRPTSPTYRTAASSASASLLESLTCSRGGCKSKSG